MRSFKQYKRYVDLAEALLSLILREVRYHAGRSEVLTPEEREALYSYYGDLMRNFSARSDYVRRISFLARHVLQNKGCLVLDAGCGFGTESIIAALLGAKVLGVDLSVERIAVARKRVQYYERVKKRRLDVTFEARDVSSLEVEEEFDLVWANEFISHVFSPAAFIKMSYLALKRGGFLVVCDTSYLCAFSAARAWLCHRKQLYTQAVDPRTGKRIPYAVERLLIPERLADLMKREGFAVEEVAHLAPLVAAHGVATALERLPLLKLAFPSYVVVGRKP